MNIQILAAPIIEAVSGKKYLRMSVTFKNLETGKVEAKALMNFASGAVWGTLEKAQTGDHFSVEREKNDKGFWDWKGISRQDAPQPTGAEVVQATKAVSTFTKGGGPANTWDQKNLLDRERFEFDKSKQQLIIRQSSLSAAVACLGAETSPDSVMNVAEQFVDWVNAEDEVE